MTNRILYYTADDIGVSPMTNPDDELIGNEMVRCDFCTTPYVPALEYMQHMKQLHQLKLHNLSMQDTIRKTYL